MAAAALAAGLLLLGVSRVVSGFLSLPGDRVINALRYDRPISAADVAILTRSRQSALRWFEDRTAWSDLGLAHLLAVDDPGLDEEARRARLEDAIDAVENGLALAPNDGYVWARLAIAQYHLGGPSKAVAEALTQSILIAEFDRRLVLERLDVALSVWDLLAPDVQKMFTRQVQYGSRASWRRLAELAHTPERRIRIIAGLADAPDRMEKFEAYLRRRKL